MGCGAPCAPHPNPYTQNKQVYPKQPQVDNLEHRSSKQTNNEDIANETERGQPQLAMSSQFNRYLKCWNTTPMAKILPMSWRVLMEVEFQEGCVERT